MNRVVGISVCVATLCVFSLGAQNHVMVPFDSDVYMIIEQAELRGLCSPRPYVKPYTRAQVLSIIDEIFENDGAEDEEKHVIIPQRLNKFERALLADLRAKYTRREQGLSKTQGRFYHESAIRKTDALFSAEIGINMEEELSGGVNLSIKDLTAGNISAMNFYMNGDIGSRVSFGANATGLILRSPRNETAGDVNNFYPGYLDGATQAEIDKAAKSDVVISHITTYTQPLAYFPYSYHKRWDTLVMNIKHIASDGFLPWPTEPLSVGYSMKPEINAAFFGGALTLGFSRHEREWAGMTTGSSLVFNSFAQPFVALEATFNPVPSFAFSALTGVTEYYDYKGIKTSAATNQNAFSIAMAEYNWKNYLHFDIGSTALWPKRLELGYIFPLYDNFFYQTNVGDFDNMALFFDVKGTLPGWGSLWASFYADEVNPKGLATMFSADRNMFAFQVGAKTGFPLLPFSSLSLSYTKVEPYCYTHGRIHTPWFGKNLMEMSYTNNGVGLGYYLPPNADELKLRFETLFPAERRAFFQYQMIRHGADYGPSAVDGSNYLSELHPSGRDTNPVLKKAFLRDGAYEWLHVIKMGGSRSFDKPFRLETYFEAGIVISYFTNIPEGKANNGNAYDYHVIDTKDYPQSITGIMTLGLRIFPDVH